MTKTLLAMIVIPLALTLRATVAGQAPAAASSFSGTWRLDTYLSDNPEQVARALQFDTGDVNPDVLGRGAEPGAPGGAGIGQRRPGGFGRPGTERAPSNAKLSSEDRKKLTELTGAVRFAPATLTISQTEAAVTIATDAGAPQTLRTNGKAEKHQLDAGTINRTATWEGPRLMVAYEVGHAGTLTYTYSVVPTTKQLLIRVNFERFPGQPGPFEIKLVYNPATPTP